MARIDHEWKRVLMKSQPMNLSDEIELNILSRLPVKSVFQCKSVCKKWYVLLEEALFIKTHLKRSIERFDGYYIVQLDNYNVPRYTPSPTGAVFSLCKQNFEESFELHFENPEPFTRYEIVASTNGILCIVSRPSYMAERNILLWNPAIRELKILPKFPDQHHEMTCLGFGFDPKNMDYKVVKMSPIDDSTVISIFSLRTDCWRALEVDKYAIFQIHAVHVNGRLHWLATRLPGNDWTDKLIVSFDVTEEMIVEIDLPDLDLKDDVLLHEPPESLGKSLVLSICAYAKGSEIWFMKDFGDSRSWSKLYYFPPHPILGYLVGNHCVFLENGKVIIQCSLSENLILYDPKNQTYKILGFDCQVEVVKYKESLVSVKRGGSISDNDDNHCASICDSFLWARLHPRKWLL